MPAAKTLEMSHFFICVMNRSSSQDVCGFPYFTDYAAGFSFVLRKHCLKSGRCFYKNRKQGESAEAAAFPIKKHRLIKALLFPGRNHALEWERNVYECIMVSPLYPTCTVQIYRDPGNGWHSGLVPHPLAPLWKADSQRIPHTAAGQLRIPTAFPTCLLDFRFLFFSTGRL